jgi:hypothetical protein
VENPSSPTFTSAYLLNPFLLYPTVSRFFLILIILQTAGLLGRVIRSSQGLYLNTGQHKHRINTYTCKTSITSVGFEPMISASERTTTVHTLDSSATVTGLHIGKFHIFSSVTTEVGRYRIGLGSVLRPFPPYLYFRCVQTICTGVKIEEILLLINPDCKLLTRSNSVVDTGSYKVFVWSGWLSWSKKGQRGILNFNLSTI